MLGYEALAYERLMYRCLDCDSELSYKEFIADPKIHVCKPKASILKENPGVHRSVRAVQRARARRIAGICIRQDASALHEFLGTTAEELNETLDNHTKGWLHGVNDLVQAYDNQLRPVLAEKERKTEEIKLLAKTLFLAWDEGGLVELHDENCCEDADNCQCPLVKIINDILAE